MIASIRNICVASAWSLVVPIGYKHVEPDLPLFDFESIANPGAGLSQEALGLAAGCEPSYVGRVERGRENPTLDLLETFSKALGTEPIALFATTSDATLPAGMRPGRKIG